MHAKSCLYSLCFLIALGCVTPALADDAVTELEPVDDGLTRIVAIHDLSVRRGTDVAVKERGIHPKNIKRGEKHELDRFAMIRFDSAEFGEGVEAVGLELTPVIFGDEKNKPMRFSVYGVKDGDPQDEKFTEGTYQPGAEDTILDRRIKSMLDRHQVFILGGFATDKDRKVLFTSKKLLSMVQADTNGTVTLVIVRNTDSGLNSTFAPRQSETPPTLVMKVEPSEETETAEGDAEEASAEPEA